MAINDTKILFEPVSYSEVKSLKNIKFVGIYKIECKINHKVYIGQSKNIIKRLIGRLQSRAEHSKELRQDYLKYGIDNFSFEILKETYDLNYWEVFLIQIYHATDERYGYNVSIGGLGSCGEKVNERISKALMGHFVSEETKLKMSEKSKGRPSPNKGKHPSEETRHKQSLAKLGKHLSLEHRQTLSKVLKDHRWFTNGEIEFFGKEKPEGAEWHLGRSYRKR